MAFYSFARNRFQFPKRSPGLGSVKGILGVKAELRQTKLPQFYRSQFDLKTL